MLQYGGETVGEATTVQTQPHPQPQPVHHPQHKDTLCQHNHCIQVNYSNSPSTLIFYESISEELCLTFLKYMKLE